MYVFFGIFLIGSAPRVFALTLTEAVKLLAADGEVFDFFGNSVSVSGDTAVIGAQSDDDRGEDSGSAYVFMRQGDIWTQQAKLRARGRRVDRAGQTPAERWRSI